MRAQRHYFERIETEVILGDYILDEGKGKRYPPKREQRYNHSLGGRAMTVCVAAVAERDRAIVMVADKALTFPASFGTTPMQADTGTKKIVSIASSGWQALISGEPSHAEDVLQEASALLSQDPSISGECNAMKGCMWEAYKKVREKAAIDKILRPRLLAKDLLVARSSSLLPLPNSQMLVISDELAKFTMDCALLVCGFDKDKDPHLFEVSDSNGAVSHDMAGFHAIGVGSEVAEGRLLWHEIDRGEGLGEVLYQVFDAKAHAEIIQGVGYAWDAEVMVAGKKAKSVPKRITKLIEEIWEEAVRWPFSKQAKKLDPEKWKKELKDFSRQVLS